MFGLNMWVRPFGHPGAAPGAASVGGASDQPSSMAPHLAAALPFPSAAPWMFLASRASSAAAAAAGVHAGKGAAHPAHGWPMSAAAATSADPAASLATTDKLLELHRKLMTPQQQAYASSLAQHAADLRTSSDKYSSAFRSTATSLASSEAEPGECGTSSASSISSYYPSAFIAPKRPRTESKGSASPARSTSDRDSATPGDGPRSKSCSPRGSVGSRGSPTVHDSDEGVVHPHRHQHNPHSPPSIHQPWLTPAFMTTERRSFRLENGRVVCPVCEVELSAEEVAPHYAKEMEQLYTEAAYAVDQHRKELAHRDNKCSPSNGATRSDSRGSDVGTGGAGHVTGVRYQTYLRIRQNRHDRLRLKCRGRKRPRGGHDGDPMGQGHCDEEDKHNHTHSSHRSLDSSYEDTMHPAGTPGRSDSPALGGGGGGRGSSTAGGAASSEQGGDTGGDITVDVDSCDDVDPSAPVQLKCSICLSSYSKPVTSTQCWHVFCENCWLKALKDKRLCPHCQAITSPSDLRKVSV